MKKIVFVFIYTCLIATAVTAQKKDTLTTASGLKYFFTKKGSGRLIQSGEVAVWHYSLTLGNGTKIEDSREKNAPLGEKIPSERIVKGVSEALLLMHVGDRGTFIIPASLAYGNAGIPPQANFPGIPRNATLVFDMELIDIKKEAMIDVLDKALFMQPVSDTSTPRVADMINTYKDLKKKKSFADFYRSDNDLNTIGYLLLPKYPEDAVKVFELNVEEYPKVSNVYDSLGEGYMALGEFDKAILNYEKSLQLDPKNTNAVEMIKKMKAKRAKATLQM